MKKVLIICHDFPPLRSVAALRMQSFYKYLPEFGIYPIVVSRKWSKDGSRRISHENEEVIKEINESSELHALPGISLREKLIQEKTSTFSKIQRKALTLKEKSSAFNPSYKDEMFALYNYARNILHEKKVDYILASAGPFTLFKHAARLSSEFNIPWIADYRDEWTGNHSEKKTKNLNSLLSRKEEGIEKEILSSAFFFTTVSDELRKRINSRIGIEGYVIRNGIDLDDIPKEAPQSKDKFQIVFTGTIYDSAYVESFCQGFNDFLLKKDVEIENINLLFIGSEINETRGTEKMKEMLGKSQASVQFIDALTNAQSLEKISESQLCLNLIPGNLSKGIHPVKLYEYLGLNKCVLNVESDKREDSTEFDPYIESVNNSKEVSNALSSFYQKWKTEGVMKNEVDQSFIDSISRKKQCEILSKLINES